MDKSRRLDDSALDNVAGGVLFDASGISGADPTHPWEVLDDKNGNKITSFATKQEALDYLRNNGQNHMEVNWDQVLQLRNLK
ncbi:MAG: hypothetical protein IJT16_02340 [Lachnospiraceae bacterium]|nr:hypothetical protein [Lachnospiraceae bacterium]